MNLEARQPVHVTTPMNLEVRQLHVTCPRDHPWFNGRVNVPIGSDGREMTRWRGPLRILSFGSRIPSKRFAAHPYVTSREVYLATSHGQSALECSLRLFPRYWSHLSFYIQHIHFFLAWHSVFLLSTILWHGCKVLGGVYASNTSGITAQHLEWVSTLLVHSLTDLLA